MLNFIVLTSFQVIAVGSPSIAESDLRTMTTEPKYAVRVNDLQSPAEAEKVSKIICNGKYIFFADKLCFNRLIEIKTKTMSLTLTIPRQSSVFVKFAIVQHLSLNF